MGKEKFKGVLLVSDFDETLYHTEGYVTDRDRAALEYFTAHGGRFAIATGRARTTFAPQVEKERLPINSPCVMSNGACVYDFAAGAYLTSTVLPDRAMGDMAKLLEVLPQLAMQLYHEEDIYVYNPNLVTEMHMGRVGLSYTTIPRLDDAPTPWGKVLLEQDWPILEEAQAHILAHWGEHYEAIFSNRYLLEITRKGSTKGGMVLWIADHLGIGRDHIYCVGDNQNDIPMLAVSAIPFAPANCSDEVKEWGARIMPSCDEGCIAAVVGELDKIY